MRVVFIVNDIITREVSLTCLSLSGWLHKEMRSSMKSSSLKLKKRWFVLTVNSLDYYKSSERSSSRLGTLVLNSLCSVAQPDDRVFKETGIRRKCFKMLFNINNHFSFI